MNKHKTKQPIWAWIVIVLTGGCLILLGSSAWALFAIPLLMAGFSTDSPSTPKYVPILILIIGYGILIGWVLLFYTAIRSVIRAFKKKA
ncbi:hypothetical protein FOI68_14130 [Brevibacillus sp. LEMMJ03]|uniref:Uncharacterized protein n=1 Tax=Brevibacillus thermoruber TaxID=33942 RepID=A0A9X3TNF2_9BACL|nr:MULTISPECIES: hypothetical protein [Brevibacillus]MDA5107168.1 hypothetical protein [Brevibacillus thermoruber]TRY25041.1 hypothetical protein FOI68_14130 [Brevibacillus sp. LEMMJ03]